MILVFDLVVFLMFYDGYYLSFVLEINCIFFVLFILVGFFVLVWWYKIWWLFVICIIILVVFIVVLLVVIGDLYGIIFLLIKNVIVIIEYRNVILGEMNYFYDFYVYVFSLYFGLMRKVNKDIVYIMIWNIEGEDDFDVLGVGNVEWKDNKIIFYLVYEKVIEIGL